MRKHTGCTKLCGKVVSIESYEEMDHLCNKYSRGYKYTLTALNL